MLKLATSESVSLDITRVKYRFCWDLTGRASLWAGGSSPRYRPIPQAAEALLPLSFRLDLAMLRR
jgi:hypothetical protein